MACLLQASQELSRHDHDVSCGLTVAVATVHRKSETEVTGCIATLG
jgi:hypothetical protein